ncbi:MAG TPA: hypothetical protein VGN63_18835 [Flavisolibacter sp.]|jgi:hypothetical protein|nr:hypothetical protein [Flavisolibacter sp.]
MNPRAVLSYFYAYIVPDVTIGSSHISLFMALYQLWSENDWQTPVLVKRKEVMQRSKIGSSATYHKSLRQLVQVGCIHYEPCSNPALKSKVYFVTGNVC